LNDDWQRLHADAQFFDINDGFREHSPRADHGIQHTLLLVQVDEVFINCNGNGVGNSNSATFNYI
jgi:hypothetical protein